MSRRHRRIISTLPTFAPPDVDGRRPLALVAADDLGDVLLAGLGRAVPPRGGGGDDVVGDVAEDAAGARDGHRDAAAAVNDARSIQVSSLYHELNLEDQVKPHEVNF